MDQRPASIVTVITLGLGLAGLHGGLGLSATWLLVTLPAVALLGSAWLLGGWLTGVLIARQGGWWPRRAPRLTSDGGLSGLAWHLRDLLDFLNAHWTLAALVVGGCTLTLPLAPFCFLAWWHGMCRAD